MNELDPGLKRLLKWSQNASVPEPEQAPFGFSGRVVASTKHSPAAASQGRLALRAQPTSLLQELQQRAWGIACASLALVIGGALVLFSQRASATPEPEISSALNFVANNLLQ
jgi:hypothetical protein